MKIALIVLGVLILLVLFLLSLRAGVTVEFGENGLTARARVGPLRLWVYPPKPKKAGRTKRKRAKKPKEPKEDTEAPDTKPGGSLQLLWELLPKLAELPARLRDRLHIDRLYLDLIWGGSDPADTAIGYGYANAALGALWPFLEGFRIREHRVRTAVDFDRPAPTVYLRAEVSIAIGRALALVLPLLTKYVQVNSKRRRSKKEAANHERTESSHRRADEHDPAKD